MIINKISYHPCRNCLLKSSIAFLLLLGQNPLQAQIVNDTSLPVNSQVQLNGTSFKIEGGTINQNQTNLFHSFSKFSVPTNFEAFFNNSPAIQNIFVRVTGGVMSNIDGQIRANGSASLFLLNPNGILFGPNASINIGGSFISTTANSIVFADGSEFSATNPQIIPPLTVSIPIGLQFRENQGVIRVQNTGHQLSLLGKTFFELILSPILGLNLIPGLQVSSGKTLALIGGSVVLDGGILRAGEGNVELGGVYSGRVNLLPTSLGLTLDYAGVNRFGDIQLDRQSLVDVSGNRSGSIQVQGAKVSLNDGSTIVSQNQGNLQGRNIEIRASELLDIAGFSSNRLITSQIISETQGSGAGGDINVITPKLFLRNGGKIGTLVLQYGSGRGGNIMVNAADSIELEGISPPPLLKQSQITTLTSSFVFGQTGDINISTGRLTIRDGASIVAGINIGNGSTNQLNINATEFILVEGRNAINFLPSSVANGSLAGTGDIGSLFINTPKLVVRDGGNINTSVLGQGNAGNIVINASDSVEIIGNGSEVISAAQRTPPQIVQALGFPEKPTGISGNVTINTPRLIVTDGGQVTVRNDGTGNAGNLLINADSIFLDNQGGITASTASGQGGNILLNIGNNLQIQNNGLISATAGGTGKGGNIILNTPFLLLREGATISASSPLSQGGEIRLQGLNSLQMSDNSEISVSTETGEAGSISINNNQTPVNSIQITDNSRLAAQATQPGGEAGNVTVNARRLTTNNGSSISASNMEGTIGGDIILQNVETLTVNGGEISASTVDGKAGNLQINQSQTPVNNVQLNNGSLTVEASGTGDSGNLTLNSRTLNLQNNAEISASTNSGVGGDINLQGLETLEVNNSNISASTKTGRAGNLTVNAQSVQLSGTGGLSVEATEGGTAGNLTVETGQMSVTDGAKVSVSSPQGQAGNLTIKANTLSLNRGFITAETGKSEGEGGANISLKISDLLRIENESLISVTANGLANGGNIDIDTSFLVVFPPTGANGSDIIAKAEQGDGGRIRINALGIFGIKENIATPGNRHNDLDASSESGTTGEIRLNREPDPNRGLVEQQETVVDPKTLVAENACRRGSKSEFTITGRGGLPPSIREDLNSAATQVGLVEPAPMVAGETTSRETQKNQGASISSESIVPAQGWIFNEKGEVVLVAYDPTVTGPQRLRENKKGCPVR